MITDDLPHPGPETDRLREALFSATFTADGLLDQLGAVAYAALARGETVPALRATRDGSALATLIRLFLLCEELPADRVAAVLPADELRTAGWLCPADPGDPAGPLRAAVDIRPFAGPDGEDWWVVSDAGCAIGGAAGAEGAAQDVVLGVGGASATLTQLAVDVPADRALDLGTGSGVQALHLAARGARVTVTDVNPRALHIARLTLELSGMPAPTSRQGSLYEPVRDDERFDVIVSNPPFVISPAADPAARLTYRDGGMVGDALCRSLVQGAADRLTDGGWCQLLANWEHVEGEDWRERVATWVPAGCDAWIVQREEQDVARYTELWLRDAGAHRGPRAEYRARYSHWLDAFADRGTHAIGFGWIALRRTGAGNPSVVAEEWPHAVEQPLGPEILRHFAARDRLRGLNDAALLETRFLLADGVVQEQIGLPGEEDPEHVVLRQRHGMMRATTVDTVGAGLVGSCDGTLPAGPIVDAIAQLIGEDAAVLREATPATLRSLVEQGFLHVAE
ncbi:DUF7059 domain-containing protein [Streptomyces lonarensis]|uniref:Methyltransferase n=1 Tax=Streptomyces lonarensis TaxID=700599 RepID=A0A7X6D3S9_9ACTN|nr:methyltransferase [Streptomyces lonarensis]NJQ07655.1 methyltransferase [Streptomyces lonarensis]